MQLAAYTEALALVEAGQGRVRAGKNEIWTLKTAIYLCTIERKYLSVKIHDLTFDIMRQGQIDKRDAEQLIGVRYYVK